MIFIKADDIKALLKDSVVREVVTSEEFKSTAKFLIETFAAAFAQALVNSAANELKKR